MFRNKCRIYIYTFFSKQNIKRHCYIIFLKFFLSLFFWWKTYFFPVLFIFKSFSFFHSLWTFFLILHDLMWLLQFIKNICYLFCWWDLLLLFLIQSGESIYDPQLYWFLYDIYNTINEHSRRQTPYLLLILNYFDILFLGESKSYFIPSSASSLTMISMLSLSECITCSSSSSIEYIKLFAMSFNYGLIS